MLIEECAVFSLEYLPLQIISFKKECGLSYQHYILTNTLWCAAAMLPSITCMKIAIIQSKLESSIFGVGLKPTGSQGNRIQNDTLRVHHLVLLFGVKIFGAIKLRNLSRRSVINFPRGAGWFEKSSRGEVKQHPLNLKALTWNLKSRISKISVLAKMWHPSDLGQIKNSLQLFNLIHWKDKSLKLPCSYCSYHLEIVGTLYLIKLSIASESNRLFTALNCKTKMNWWGHHFMIVKTRPEHSNPFYGP